MSESIIPCYICEGSVDTSHTNNYEIVIVDDNPKFFLHKKCAIRASEIYQNEDRSEEIFDLQRKLTDLRMSYSELDETVKNSVDSSSLIEYLEEFIELQRLSSKRAPQGSMENRINAFRSNDAEALLQMVRSLLPVRAKQIE